MQRHFLKKHSAKVFNIKISLRKKNFEIQKFGNIASKTTAFKKYKEKKLVLLHYNIVLIISFVKENWQPCCGYMKSGKR